MTIKTIKINGIKIDVTNDGRIFRSSTGKEYSYCSLTFLKYPAINVYNPRTKIQKLLYVHQAVAKAFLKTPRKSKNKDWQINHKDSNPKNNNLNNLEWVTRKENNSTEHKKRMLRKNHIHTYRGNQIIQGINVTTGEVKHWKNGIVASKDIGCSHVLVYNVLKPDYPANTAKGWSLTWVSSDVLN